MIPFLFLILLLITGCENKPVPAKPTFSDVKPIFQSKCMSCHSDGFQPHGHSTNWLDESVVRNRLDKIKERVVVKRDMPLGNTLTPKEYQTIDKWIEERERQKDDDDLVMMILIMGSM